MRLSRAAILFGVTFKLSIAALLVGIAMRPRPPIDTAALLDAYIRAEIGWPFPLSHLRDQKCQGTSSCIAANGYHSVWNLTTGSRDTAEGPCAGWSLTSESDNILVGAGADIPHPGSDGFVNLYGKICWWRFTGKAAPCPPRVACPMGSA